MNASLDSALQEAIAKAGGQSALADFLGIRPPAVHGWRRCPAERVLEVERASGVHRSRLRPDLYPPHEYGLNDAQTPAEQP